MGALSALAGCTNQANIDSSIDHLAGSLKEAAETDDWFKEEKDDDDDESPGLLSVQDARAVIRAHLILEQAGGGEGADWKPDDLSEQTLELAKQTLSPTEFKEARDLDLDFSKMLPEDRARLVKDAKSTLAEVTQHTQVARANGSLPKLARVEVIAKEIQADLRKLAPRSPIPKNPLALLPASELRGAVDGLQRMERSLAESHALTGIKGTVKSAQLLLVKQYREQFEAVIGSDEQRVFEEQLRDISKEISTQQWAEAEASRTKRIAASWNRKIVELKAATGWPEILIETTPTRGPPLEKVAMTSVRAFDADPRQWINAEANLRALSEEIVRNPNLPEEFRKPAISPHQRVALLLETESLRRIQRTLSPLLADAPSSPDSKLFPERKSHLVRWQQSVETELARRANGGPRFSTTDGAVDKLIATYDHINKAVQPRGEANLLRMVEVRYPGGKHLPQGLASEVQFLLQLKANSFIAQSNQLSKLFQETANQRLAMGTEASSISLKDAKMAGAHLSFEMDSFVKEAQRMGFKFDAVLPDLQKLKAMFPPRPPPGSTPGVAASTNPLLPSQPGLHKSIVTLEQNLAQLQRQISDKLVQSEGIKTSPVAFASDKGRLIASRADFKVNIVDWKSFQFNAAQSRLPKEHADWQGRLSPEGKPFDFRTEVKQPRNFRALGGGIHLGETAEVSGDFSDKALIFEEGKGLFFRDPKGKEWMIDSESDPVDLKALYRFAISGRNAAISIGWGTERTSVFDQPESPGQTVLLDPYLVDTSVGQDLILADTIPWSFDEPKLPNGRDISFSKQFRDAYQEFRDNDAQELRSVVENVQPYRPADRSKWFSVLNSPEIPVVIRSLLKFDQVSDEMKEWLVGRKLMDEATQIPDFPFQISDPQLWRETIENYFYQQIYDSNLEEAKDLGMSTFEARQALENISYKIRSSARTTTAKVIQELNLEDSKKMLDDLPSSSDEALKEIITLVVLATLERGSCPRSLVELWCSLKLAEGAESHSLASSLKQTLSQSTLAALHDEAVHLSLLDESVVFDSQMRYLYATTHVYVTQSEIGRGKSPTEKEHTVKEIEPLTRISNDHLNEVADAFPPLNRIIKFAEIAALFRWADRAFQDGLLAGIDLSDLGSYPANDRERFPTVDVLIQ
tara:strand:+ start:11461 stop:14895 length:3435 start_codon:yes stop_codon:yes gene_type:complete